MRIAILGSRGIPGNYGGFEICAEQLSTRLVRLGHDVTVYCCKGYSLNKHVVFYEGVRRIVLPTIHLKWLEKLLFTVLSLTHATLSRVDVLLMLGVSAAAFCFIPRVVGTKLVINVDGLEWQRKKWGRIVSFYLHLSERAACLTANRVVTDSRYVQDHYRTVYGQETIFIPYGVVPNSVSSDGTLRSLGIVPGEYFLYVSRFEPENNAHLVRRAFEKIRTSKKLVMLGDAPYAQTYINQVKDTRDPRIIFPGTIYGRGYFELQSYAYAYVQASEVGGTPPALVEAVGYGHCIIANHRPQHEEVLGEAGLYYDGTEAGLIQRLQEVVDRPELVNEYRDRVSHRARLYSWDTVVREYEGLFFDLLH